MLTNSTQNLPNAECSPKPVAPGHGGLLKKTVHGVVVAGTIAAFSLTAIPTTAHAGGPGVGAAIGLGILGGVLAGAAIASTAPVYAAPSPYYYDPNGYYYNTAPTSYSQPYYGAAPYPYPQYNSYGYYYSR